ncbi:MAG: hypothetical protein KAR11_08405 [Phycisphaerae bacterium]|nr:hypothetical protein [Phycisphaerae bacterium]
MNSKSGKFSPGSQFLRSAAGIILALALPLCCLGDDGNQADPSESSANTSTAKSETSAGQPATAQENPSLKQRLSEEEREQEKRELRIMLFTSIIILSGFFLAVILITLLRIGRRYRRAHQPGRGKEPTELFDAWSNYRLDEDAFDSDESDNQKS